VNGAYSSVFNESVDFTRDSVFTESQSSLTEKLLQLLLGAARMVISEFAL